MQQIQRSNENAAFHVAMQWVVTFTADYISLVVTAQQVLRY